MKYYLYNEDAYQIIDDILAKIPAHLSVGLVVDPPYDFNNSGGGRYRKERHSSNQIVKMKMDKGFDESILFMDRFSSVACFMHNDQVFTIGARLKAHYGRAVICGWDKPNPAPMANKNYQADWEPYIHAWKPGSHPVGDLSDKKRLSRHGREKRATTEDLPKGHPTQKPVDLMRKIVRNMNCDIIVDLFMGSGATGVACAIEGRNFIGVEVVKEFFDLAEKRIKEAAGF